MKRLEQLFLVGFILTVSFVHSQEQLLAHHFDDNAGSFLRTKKTYTLTHSPNHELVFFIQEKKKAYALLIDKDYQVKVQIAAEKALIPRYDEIIGYNYKNGHYYLVAKHEKSDKKYALIHLDFNAQTIICDEFTFELGNRQHIATVQHRDQILLMSVDKTNTLQLWKFNNKDSFAQIAEFSIPLNGENQELFNTLFRARSVTKIDNRVPAGLEQTGNDVKLYPREDHLYLSFDNEKDAGTTLHDIDLVALKIKSQFFPYPTPTRKEYDRFNSYLLGTTHLAQIAVNAEDLKLEIKTREGKTVKTFSIFKTMPISFANSPLYQDGSTYFNRLRELKSNEQYLRKLSNGHAGISGYEVDGQYRLSIGGYKKKARGGMIMAGSGIGTMPTGDGGVATTFNPTYTGYNYSTNSTAIFFNTNLDMNFNHIDKKDIQENIFETIDKMAKTNKKTTAEDIFFYQGRVHFLYYDQREKTYNLFRIE